MASKRHLRQKSCGDKKKHPSMQAAKRHISLLKSAGKLPITGWMNAYYCRFCGSYHVGHPPG